MVADYSLYPPLLVNPNEAYVDKPILLFPNKNCY